MQIDSVLKKLQEQNEELKTSLLGNLQGSLGRAGGGEVGNSNKGLERKLDELQNSVQADVRGSVKKLEEVQGSQAETKRDLDKKLGKMMNIMTSLYEASEKKTDTVAADQQDGSATVFLTEYMDVLEQRIKEELSVVSTKLHNEMKSVERAVSSVMDETQGIASRIEGMGPQQTQSLQVLVESAVLNVTRKEREVRSQLEERIQTLERSLLQKESSKDDGGNAVTEVAQGCSHDAARVNVTRPESCWELHRAGASCDGVYVIYPQHKHAIYVHCDMTGGGWTVLMRRGDFETRTDFHRDWESYKIGFGELSQEFWLGNENIHLLTTQEEVVLHVHVEDFEGEMLDIEYEPFSVASEGEKYRLHVGSPKGVSHHLGNSLRYHNGKPFSTLDQNNDTPRDDCPGRYRGGWWYNRCHYVLLTAPYFREKDVRQKWQGIQWHSWKGTGILKAVEMKIRPKPQSKEPHKASRQKAK